MEDPIADFLEWYGSRPPVTKTYLTLSSALALLLSTGVIPLHQIYYSFGISFWNL